MLRFPDDKVCYVFPLLNEQSAPEKLIRDLEKAKQVRTEKFPDRSTIKPSWKLRSSCSEFATLGMRHKTYSLTLLGDLTDCRIDKRYKWSLNDP